MTISPNLTVTTSTGPSTVEAAGASAQAATSAFGIWIHIEDIHHDHLDTLHLDVSRGLVSQGNSSVVMDLQFITLKVFLAFEIPSPFSTSTFGRTSSQPPPSAVPAGAKRRRTGRRRVGESKTGGDRRPTGEVRPA